MLFEELVTRVLSLEEKDEPRLKYLRIHLPEIIDVPDAKDLQRLLWGIPHEVFRGEILKEVNHLDWKVTPSQVREILLPLWRFDRVIGLRYLLYKLVGHFEYPEIIMLFKVLECDGRIESGQVISQLLPIMKPVTSKQIEGLQKYLPIGEDGKKIVKELTKMSTNYRAPKKAPEEVKVITVKTYQGDAVAASQSGKIITGVNTTFTNEMVGGIICWPERGISTMIVKYQSEISLTASEGHEVPSGKFAVYYGGLMDDRKGK